MVVGFGVVVDVVVGFGVVVAVVVGALRAGEKFQQSRGLNRKNRLT